MVCVVCVQKHDICGFAVSVCLKSLILKRQLAFPNSRLRGNRNQTLETFL